MVFLLYWITDSKVTGITEERETQREWMMQTRHQSDSSTPSEQPAVQEESRFIVDIPYDPECIFSLIKGKPKKLGQHYKACSVWKVKRCKLAGVPKKHFVPTPSQETQWDSWQWWAGCMKGKVKVNELWPWSMYNCGRVTSHSRCLSYIYCKKCKLPLIISLKHANKV